MEFSWWWCLSLAEQKCLNLAKHYSVDDIIADLTLAERVGTADLDENEFHVLELTLGKFVRYKLEHLDVGVYGALKDYCISKSGRSDDVPPLIIKELLKRLRESNKLRVVK